MALDRDGGQSSGSQQLRVRLGGSGVRDARGHREHAVKINRQGASTRDIA